jgi:hypothetical protein
MNNEPVAWIGKDELQFGFTDTRVTNEKESWDDIPLYTHPAKTLTDEEILEVKKTVEYNQFMTAGEYAFNVAKAALKKASEK